MNNNKKTITQRALERNVQKDLDSIVSGARKELSRPAVKYMKQIIDPRGSALTPSITNIGGYHGHVGLVRCRVKGTMGIGAGGGAVGYGIIQFNPSWSGPYIDRNPVLFTSGSAYLGTASSSLPANNAVPGVATATWTEAPFTAVGSNGIKASYRCISAAIYITPRSNKLEQDGELYLLEEPNHQQATTPIVSDIVNHKRSRLVVGAQEGNPSNENVLNFHPKGQFQGTIGDFEFHFQNGASGDGSANEKAALCIVASGTANVQYHFECIAVYETIGTQSVNNVRRLVDTRGDNLIQNAMATKTISGWVGTAKVAEHSYLAQMWHVGAKLFDFATSPKRADERRRLLDAARSAASLVGF